jgi:hypothetical protein
MIAAAPSVKRPTGEAASPGAAVTHDALYRDSALARQGLGTPLPQRESAAAGGRAPGGGAEQ